PSQRQQPQTDQHQGGQGDGDHQLLRVRQQDPRLEVAVGEDAPQRRRGARGAIGGGGPTRCAHRASYSDTRVVEDVGPALLSVDAAWWTASIRSSSTVSRSAAPPEVTSRWAPCRAAAARRSASSAGTVSGATPVAVACTTAAPSAARCSRITS